MLPPPIARRSTPRSASASASDAIAPGSFFSWTTNCLAMLPPRAAPPVAGVACRQSYPRTTGTVPASRPRLTREREPPGSEVDGASIRLDVSPRRPGHPVEIDGHPSVEQRLPRRPARGAQRDGCFARFDECSDGAVAEAEPCPCARMARLVDDGVSEAADPMDDRRRPVAQRDHLALPARFESRGHREEVGAGIDLAGHDSIETLDERDLCRVSLGHLAEWIGERGGSAALDDEAHAVC